MQQMNWFLNFLSKTGIMLGFSIPITWTGDEENENSSLYKNMDGIQKSRKKINRGGECDGR